MRTAFFIVGLSVSAACSSEKFGPEAGPELPTPNECALFRCSFTPLVVDAGPFRALNASRFESCGLSAPGSLTCWGLVAGTGASPPAPTHPDLTFQTISSGDAHHCGLTTAGQAYCWGSNTGGELGRGETGAVRFEADTVDGALRFRAIAAGFRHSCGISLAGEAYCWGSNILGELGVDMVGEICFNGNAPCAPAPVRVDTELRFTDIVAGSFYTCAVATDGQAYCWGDNIESETTTTRGGPEPRRVDANLTFTTLSAGASHACGLTGSGAAYCWGSSAALDGALGNPTDVAGAVAVAGGVTFVTLVSGTVHNCGLTGAGVAHCWGSNRVGQLGALTTTVCFGFTCSRIPIAVSGNLRFVALAAGADHTCAVTDAGETYCWGAGNAGQLGSPSAGAGAPPPASAASGWPRPEGGFGRSIS